MKQKTASLTQKILFIDSGIGGLTTLSETAKILNANYIYYADNKFAPYGTKSSLFLQHRLCSIINEVSKSNIISIVVLACNTATTSSIQFLRQQFPSIKFVGTEPACKFALDKKFLFPAIIATPQTISNVAPFYSNCINLISNPELASIIESITLSNNLKSKYKLLKFIYNLKHKIELNDCLILGCTHYIFIKSKLEKNLKIPVIDGNEGVSKQIKKTYSRQHITKSTFKILLSDKNSTTLQKYKKILRQILANSIKL